MPQKREQSDKKIDRIRERVREREKDKENSKEKGGYKGRGNIQTKKDVDGYWWGKGIKRHRKNSEVV